MARWFSSAGAAEPVNASATRRKRLRVRLIAALLIPSLTYPLLMLTLLVQDSIIGDREFFHHVFYEAESRREVVVLMLADWAYALPWLYGITPPLWLGSRAISGRSIGHGPRSLAIAGGLAGAILAGWFSGTALAPATLSFAITGALAGFALGTVAPPVRQTGPV